MCVSVCGLEEGIGHGGWEWEVRGEKGSQRLWSSNPLISQIRKARPRVISNCIPIRYQSLVQVQGLVWSKMSHFSGKKYLWVVYQAGFRNAASNKGCDKAKEAECDGQGVESWPQRDGRRAPPGQGWGRGSELGSCAQELPETC